MLGVDAIAHAVADPVRRRILEVLDEHSMTAGDVAALFDISRPAVSRHLRVLRESGLVTDRLDGRHREYAINQGALEPLVSWAAQLGRAKSWENRLDALETEVRRTARDRRAKQSRKDTA